jgi:ribosomal protein L7/L12
VILIRRFALAVPTFDSQANRKTLVDKIPLEVNIMSTVEQQEINLLRSRINQLEAQVDFLYRHLGVRYVEQKSLADDPRVLAALRKNSMIEAIKYYREINDVGLAEAKAAVEAIRARHGI